MSSLIELLEFLNTCSPERAGAYMFFITVCSYAIITSLNSTITNIVFVISGYKDIRKNKKSKNNDTDKDVS